MSETAVVHIIDDDESVRAALNGLLCSVGLIPVPHASVSEFLAAKKPDVPGCLVLDVRMPGISGLDFQEELCGLGIHLPVILMTGHGDIRMSVRGMKAGAVDFLTKPFREQDMLDAVATAVRRDRVRRDAEAAIVGLREKFSTLSPAQMLSRVEFDGDERMRLAYGQGKGVIFVTGHFGFWELHAMVHQDVATMTGA